MAVRKATGALWASPAPNGSPSAAERTLPYWGPGDIVQHALIMEELLAEDLGLR